MDANTVKTIRELIADKERELLETRQKINKADDGFITWYEFNEKKLVKVIAELKALIGE